MLLLALGCSPSLQRSANPGSGDWPERAELDEIVLNEMGRSRIPGLAACTFEGGEVTWCQGYGLAEIEADRLATEDTPFLVASVSKAVVAVAALEAGLELDEPAQLGFELSHPRSDADITPRMLGSHVSGVVDNWDVIEAEIVQGDSDLPLDEFLESYLVRGGARFDADLNWDERPEQAYEYSNIGAAALAVEVHRGQDFAEFCSAALFQPMELEHTSWHLATLSGEPAVPYTVSGGEFVPEGHYGFPDYPNGQLRTSAWDLSRLALAWGEDERLRERAWPGLDPDQGFGWYRWQLEGQTVWGHNGGEVGVSAEIGVLGDGRGFVVLMNGEGRGDTLERIEAALLEL